MSHSITYTCKLKEQWNFINPTHACIREPLKGNIPSAYIVVYCNSSGQVTTSLGFNKQIFRVPSMKVPHFCKLVKAVTHRKQVFQKRHDNCLIFQSPPVVNNQYYWPVGHHSTSRLHNTPGWEEVSTLGGPIVLSVEGFFSETIISCEVSFNLPAKQTNVYMNSWNPSPCLHSTLCTHTWHEIYSQVNIRITFIKTMSGSAHA